MPKYTRKIIKNGGSRLSGMTSRKSMSNLNNSSQKTTRKREISPSSNSNTHKRPKLTLDLNAAEEADKELNDEEKREAEIAEYRKEKFSNINNQIKEQKERGKYLPLEKGSIHIDQTISAAEEVGDEWNAQRKYGKASDSGATFSPFKAPTKNNKNSSTVFGFPNFKSPIQGSPLPILSPQSSYNKSSTSIFKTPYPKDLFPMSPGKGGKKHRKKTYKSYKMKKTNRNKNRKSRRNSKRNSKKNKK